MQIYLDQAREASQSATHVCEEVVFQVQDLEIGALAGKHWQVGVLGIADLKRTQILSTHLQVSLGQQVRCVVNGRLLACGAQEQHPRQWLYIPGQLNRRQLVLWRVLNLSCLICDYVASALHDLGVSFVVRRHV